MRRGTPRRSEQNQSFDEEIGKIPEQLPRYLEAEPFAGEGCKLLILTPDLEMYSHRQK